MGYGSLFVDDEAWERAGRELKECDPQRYLAILKVVEDICSIHKNPMAKLAGVDAAFVFSRTKSDDKSS